MGFADQINRCTTKLLALTANCTVLIGALPPCPAEFIDSSKQVLQDGSGLLTSEPTLLVLDSAIAADQPVYETLVTVSGHPSGDGDYSVLETLPDGLGLTRISLTKADP